MNLEKKSLGPFAVLWLLNEEMRLLARHGTVTVAAD